MKKTIVFIGILFLFLGCSRYFVTVEQQNPYKLKRKLDLHNKRDKERLEKISNCQKEWNYQILNDTLTLNVIQYIPAYRQSLVNINAMVIGIVNNDTIRVLSRNYYEILKIGQVVFILPDSLSNSIIRSKSEMDIALLKSDAPTHLAKKKNEDIFYCTVKNTYFGVLKK